jgi:hypothetical protein
VAVTEHYLPCVLFPLGGPDTFSVGPVTFNRTDQFFKDKKPLLKRSVEASTTAHIKHVKAAQVKGMVPERAYSALESRQLVRLHQASAVKTYRSYPWIASVKVTDCDHETSQERATRAVEMALHVLRVLLGAQPTRKVRLAGSLDASLRTAHLYADDQGVIQTNLTWNALGPTGTANWHEVLMRGTKELTLFGSALKPIVDPIEMHHLHHRLIDAINWFGDAATDLSASSSIVKYVSAIERLFFGKKPLLGKHTRIFAKRVKSVLEAYGVDEDRRANEQAHTVYKARSNLLHGELSPSDDQLQETVALAEALSRMCLLCAAWLYPMILKAFGKADAAKLEDVMARISAEGLDWLAKESAMPIREA